MSKVGINIVLYLSRKNYEEIIIGGGGVGFISRDDTHDRGRTFYTTRTSHENRWRVIPFAALLAYLATLLQQTSNVPDSQARTAISFPSS